MWKTLVSGFTIPALLAASLASGRLSAADAVPPVPADVVEPPAAVDAPPRQVLAEPLPIEEIRRYVSVYRTVQQAYVEEVGEEELMQSAIRGLLNDLDPHSAYLDREAAEAMTEQATGAYDGIGVELQQQPDRSLLVIAPIDDTPAARAGLRSGDVITEIDGEPIRVDSVDGAVQTLRGPPGSSVDLTVLRDGEPGPITLTVVRERIQVASVRSRLLEAGYGYLRISTFQADTSRQVRRMLDELSEGSGGALTGLVLDLRSNPGGLLNAAVEVADAFIDEGVIVSTRGRLPFSNTEFSASPGDRLEGAPIIALIDSGTASASEVLAGALRDHGRARLMGNRSFGKGSVQTLLPLDNGDSLKLTTARYYTPKGTSIQARGLRPDLPVVSRNGNGRRNLRESDLPQHLGGDPRQADDGLDEEDEDRVIDAALEALKQWVAGGTLDPQAGARGRRRAQRG